jgi:hypothetical protein
MWVIGAGSCGGAAAANGAREIYNSLPKLALA